MIQRLRPTQKEPNFRLNLQQVGTEQKLNSTSCKDIAINPG